VTRHPFADFWRAAEGRRRKAETDRRWNAQRYERVRRAKRPAMVAYSGKDPPACEKCGYNQDLDGLTMDHVKGGFCQVLGGGD
jgi:hypothetical protein